MAAKEARRCLSAEDFDLGLDHVTSRLAALPVDLSWSLVDLGASRELVLRFVRPLPAGEEQETQEEKEEEQDEEEEEELDFDCAPKPTAECSLLQLELRVLYSAAYEVPVLFCRAWDTCTARPAPLDLLWRLFSVQTGAKASELLNCLGPAEHPPTGLPMFALHPCRTAQVMATLKPQRPEHFVMAWLSVFGTALGLRLPSALFKEEEEISQDDIDVS